MQTTRRNRRWLLCAITLSVTVACATPNLNPFADATAQLHQAMTQSEMNVRLSLKAAGAEDQAQAIGGELSARISAMAAVVKYADALANICEAGQTGGDGAGSLANALDGFLGAVSAPGMPSAYVETAKSAYGIIASVRAASSLAAATAAADPAIQGIAEILIQDFDQLKAILMVTGQQLNNRLITENNDMISYRQMLEKRRRQIETETMQNMSSPRKLDHLQEISVLIDMTRDRYEPLMRTLKDTDARTALQVQIVESAKRGIVQWAAIHGSLAANLSDGLAPNSRLIAATVVEIRELIKKEDQR